VHPLCTSESIFLHDEEKVTYGASPPSDAYSLYMKMNVSIVSVTGAESLSMERSVSRLHEGIRLHLYVGVYSPLVSIRGLLPPTSLSSAIPCVFLMNLCSPMFLRHPVGFDGYLAGISLSSCTLFSFVNIGADMLRIPLCLIEHVGILQKSA